MPQVMSFPCSAALATRSPGFSSHFGVAAAIIHAYTRDALGLLGPRAIPSTDHRSLAALRLQHGPLFFFLFWRCGCYYPCSNKGCFRSIGAQGHPKHCLVVVEYEMPFERNPQVTSFPCSAELASRIPLCIQGGRWEPPIALGKTVKPGRKVL